MDRPTSRRAAIGRALNAREPLSTDAFLSLTEEERSRGVALFSDEQGTPAEQHETFERGAAPVAPMAPTARMFKDAVRPAEPEAPIMEVWQARVLGVMLTAAVVGFAVAAVRMIESPTGSRPPLSSARAAAPPVPVTRAPRPAAVAAVSPAPIADIPVAKNDLAAAVVVPVEAASLAPAPARVAPVTRPKSEAQPQPQRQAVRPSAPLRSAVVASPIVAAPPPAVEAPIAPNPVAALAAAPPRVEATASPAAVPEPSPAPDAAIHTVLTRYRAAYGDLDVGAARAVWPSADTKALRRAFDSLEEQELVFDSCAVSMGEARAVAVCSGTASYVPRVGKRARRGDQRQWEFELSKAGNGWLIDTVSAR